MKRWGHRRILLAQRLVSLRSQFTCKPRILTIHAKPTSTQPKAQKNLALNTKGDNVIAKRLILSHTKQRQSYSLTCSMSIKHYSFLSSGGTHGGSSSYFGDAP